MPANCLQVEVKSRQCYLLTLLLLPLVSCQVALTAPNFRVGTITCPGDKIVFFCSVNGSQTLSWSSNEYIGSNGAQLEFSHSNSIGTKINSTTDSSVFANLIINSRNDSFLQSALHLTSNQSSTVSCLTVNAGSRRSISFTVLRSDPPGIPQNAAAAEIPSIEDNCVLLVTWNPPENVDERTTHYMVRTSQETEIPEIIENSTLASFLSPCKDLLGITINVTAVDVCGNEGGTTNNFEPRLNKIVTDPSDATRTTSTNTLVPLPPNTELSNTSDVGVTILAVLIGLAVILVFVIITCVIVVIKCLDFC